MMYTPSFLKVKETLRKPILEYIKKYQSVNAIAIHKYIEQLTNTNPELYKLIHFSYSYPYSDQVSEVLTDLIRHCIIRETNEGYSLTSHGESLIK